MGHHEFDLAAQALGVELEGLFTLAVEVEIRV
jgi:hypothetical protein